MPTNRNYTNLTINRERAENARALYETLGNDQTFNTSALDLIESGIEKLLFLKEHFSDYVFAELDGEGFAIIDKSKDKITRIHFKEDNLMCSEHGNELCNHKFFAAFHPKFKGGKGIFLSPISQ
jgi:hypothetical protein